MEGQGHNHATAFAIPQTVCDACSLMLEPLAGHQDDGADV